MAGGGTGGHVIPALAVARVLRDRGHVVHFIGTASGLESKLVPEAGFPLETIRIGQLNRVGPIRQAQTLSELPASLWAAASLLRRNRAAAVFSMGGYVAGPVMLASVLGRVPLVVMEPNAMPGFANRRVGRFVYRALLAFEAGSRWFPEGRSEVTGLPVRPEFLDLPVKPAPPEGDPFSVLITGGSRGSRTLNRASRESWPLFRSSGAPVCILHQAGAAESEALGKEFSASGLPGEVVPFIGDMARAFRDADLVVGRAGAGGVAELAAARMPGILVPLPFAADDHQRRNAEALVKAGAALMVLDAEMSGQRLFEEVEKLRRNPELLDAMRTRMGAFRKTGAAERAADIIEEAARQRKK
jgi:UDP-N-acetylglucosamine--N-acetylmuramyl-(pentapeptide) pyrophosphoryl-undecaprenol N-acetylglucosamine transferase